VEAAGSSPPSEDVKKTKGKKSSIFSKMLGRVKRGVKGARRGPARMGKYTRNISAKISKKRQGLSKLTKRLKFSFRKKKNPVNDELQSPAPQSNIVGGKSRRRRQRTKRARKSRRYRGGNGCMSCGV